MDKTARLKENKVAKLSQQLRLSNEELLAMNIELDQSLAELKSMNKKFTSIINIVSDLNHEDELKEKEFLSYILKNAVNIVSEADYGSIYLLEDGCFKLIESIGHDLEKLKKIQLESSSLHYNKTRILTDSDYYFSSDQVSEKLNDKLCQALKEAKESITANIVVNEMIIGQIVLDIAEDSIEQFRDSSKTALDSFAALASSFFTFRNYHKLQNEFTKELISSIIAILEIYDDYTKGHSENVANLSAKIAKKMNLSKSLVAAAYWSGMVHDIGKILIPIEILNKKEQLSKKEYKLIQKHPIWGSEALSKSDSLKQISKYVLHHHERWDGRGYPAGKQKNEIPLISQIISVADSWDAMCSKRAYRDSLSQKEALAELKRNKAKQFSPKVVDVFLNNFF